MKIAGPINGALRQVPAWTLYAAGAVWLVWLFWQAASGMLGPDPVRTLERKLGLLALQLLIATLAVTPVRRWFGINLIRHRRALGLLVFFYVLVHFLTWAVLDMGLYVQQALGDIVKRPFVTAGMVGLVALIPLAVTSNNAWVRRLGSLRWQRLHKLTYLVAVAGALHYLWLVKSWWLQPMVYAAVILGLLALRLAPGRASATARA
ncbi:MAG: protein-methionine-sulfoxide reductase heme-binding subunit MsrQ [Pseudomonadota bacterium]|jgi:sulfoxide reductase heme-binding subunit YedZ